jgi:hypothetical protein
MSMNFFIEIIVSWCFPSEKLESNLESALFSSRTSIGHCILINATNHMFFTLNEASFSTAMKRHTQNVSNVRIAGNVHKKILKKEELLEGGIVIVERLSPAEKYDLLVGKYNWSLTHRTISSSSPNEPHWTRYGHEWSRASLAYEEPKPVVLEKYI